MKQVSWGIIGSSYITEQFCRQLIRVPGARIKRFCSRRKESVNAISKAFSVPQSTTDISDLLNDEQIDAIYISSPTHLHVEHTLACLKAGKAVLCEKPLATSSKEIEKIISISAANNTFCMEAMWMRFNPLVQQLKKLVVQGAIGEIKSVHIEVGYQKDAKVWKDRTRGAVWNYSVYAISLLQYLFQEAPERISFHCDPIGGSATSFQALLQWTEGPVACVSSATNVHLMNEATFFGTKGNLVLAAPFFCSTQLKCDRPVFDGSRLSSKINGVLRLLGRNKLLETPFLSICDGQSGFYYEALEVHNSLNNKRLESDVMPLADSLAVALIAETFE